MTTAPEARTRRQDTDPALYINRELSWLDFNDRVLALARDPGVPLLERCKFLAIFTSNLDEFFMVRVATVQDALEAGRLPSTPDKLPREQVLHRIRERVVELTGEQSRIWREELQPELAEAGIRVSDYGGLGADQRRAVDERFDREVYAALTPLAVGPGLPFPYISGLSLNLGLRVRDPVNGETRFARVKVPPRLPRLIPVDDRLVFIEDVIQAHAARLFPGMEVVESARFRVTRDADFSISDESDDLIGAVEAQLRRRRFGHVVRLEVEESARRPAGRGAHGRARGGGQRDLPGAAAARLHDALEPGDHGPPGPARPALGAAHAARACGPTTATSSTCSPSSATATCSCTTPTTTSTPASSASWSRPSRTRTSWRSSRPCTAPAATRRSSRP